MNKICLEFGECQLHNRASPAVEGAGHGECQTQCDTGTDARCPAAGRG